MASDLPARVAWQWLAPAMAMGLLAMMMVGNSFPRSAYLGAAQPSNLIATVALRPHMASYYAASHYHEHNILPNATFEWTNGSQALTSAASFLDTNSSKP